MATEMNKRQRRKQSIPDPAGQDDRGSDTRFKLLEAGLDLFGRQGFDGTSTRALADHAGVNLGAIPYHFGGKEGLYVAVAEHIATQMRAQFGQTLPPILEAMARGLTPDEARLFLRTIAERFVDVIVGAGPGERWAPFVIREQMFPTPAFERIYVTFISPMHSLACQLVAIARGHARPDDPVRVFTLIGQMLVFRAARASVLKKLEWDAVTPERLAEIKAVLQENFDAIVRGSSQS